MNKSAASIIDGSKKVLIPWKIIKGIINVEICGFHFFSEYFI
jgi:hypothetical protein